MNSARITRPLRSQAPYLTARRRRRVRPIVDRDPIHTATAIFFTPVPPDSRLPFREYLSSSAVAGTLVGLLRFGNHPPFRRRRRRQQSSSNSFSVYKTRRARTRDPTPMSIVTLVRVPRDNFTTETTPHSRHSIERTPPPRCSGIGTVSLPTSCKYRELKCADTTGTALVPWSGHFQC